MANEFSLVDCTEEFGTLSESFSEKVQNSVTLRCAFADRWALVWDIFGFNRTNPHYPGRYPSSASIVPDETQYTKNGQQIIYEQSLVTIEYGSTNEDAGQTAVAEAFEPAIEAISTPVDVAWLNGERQNYSVLKWKDELDELLAGTPNVAGRIPLDFPMAYTYLTFQWTRQIFRVPGPLSPSLITLAGSCNQSAITSSYIGLTFPKETLKYAPPIIRKTTLSDGSSEGFNLTMSYAYRGGQDNSGNDITWNKYYRPAFDEWQEISKLDSEGGDVIKQVPPKDWNAILYGIL